MVSFGSSFSKNLQLLRGAHPLSDTRASLKRDAQRLCADQDTNKMILALRADFSSLTQKHTSAPDNNNNHNTFLS